VILIKPSDPKSWLNKVKSLLDIVDKELGYADTELGDLSDSQVLHTQLYNSVIIAFRLWPSGL
jgi:hypothetical protein